MICNYACVCAGADALEELADQDHFFNTVSPQFTNTETIIQLYRASQLPIFQNEPILDKINVWTSTFLRHQLLNQDIYDERLHKEVITLFQNIFLSICYYFHVQFNFRVYLIKDKFG